MASKTPTCILILVRNSIFSISCPRPLCGDKMKREKRPKEENNHDDWGEETIDRPDPYEES